MANSLGIEEDAACRVVFNEITKDAVKDSFKEPRAINMDLVNAQQARRVLDRLVGYNISPLLWKKIKKGLSAGRVQSVAVKLIIDRENEINNFTPEEYWSIETEFTHNGETFTAKFYGVDGKKKELKSREDVDQILKQLNGKDFTVDQVNKRERRRNPSSPFTTSSLQQEAFRKLNFRAKKTMMIAQQLYEGIDLGGREGTTGLITYMRTDSTRISDTAKQEAATLIQNKYGENYLGKSRAKKSQQKHKMHTKRSGRQLSPKNLYLSKPNYQMTNTNYIS